MEELLKEVMAELKYHRKLLESMAEARDEERYNRQKIQKNMMGNIMKLMSSMGNIPPGVKQEIEKGLKGVDNGD
jgi:hypothetical protein